VINVLLAGTSARCGHVLPARLRLGLRRGEQVKTLLKPMYRPNATKKCVLTKNIFSHEKAHNSQNYLTLIPQISLVF
jgi:hypothetical protein